MPTFEIEIKQEDLDRIKKLKDKDKKLRERFDNERGDIAGQQLQDLINAIDGITRDIHNILLVAIYENKEWQK